ncbi:helix-turn-helix transcriptional regulator [Altibacter sp. HG106]|uniref:helix-turn-helix transcriptional regulator n=1 Tax=Altibacter sp. HG106 TaxID=3023937 RepID=UPI00234FE593|nr:response regulator transcription factor [Altibacter sp. HG106]MDC7995320.1 helix-turn-helix transcriptional regulator [Altibacter sp. HG106]
MIYTQSRAITNLMQHRSQGEFYGTHHQKKVFGNIVSTDTVYTHPKVDWHYHENPYFTYLLQGKLFEANKKEAYHLEAGDLLFHHWQDAHYNIKPPDLTRGFHIEINTAWFQEHDIALHEMEGSVQLRNPHIKHLMNLLFVEFSVADSYSNFGVEVGLVELFGTLMLEHSTTTETPQWVLRLQQKLHEEPETISLQGLSAEVGVHPAHLSRAFRKYFGVGMSQYVRLVRLNTAFQLMLRNEYTLTDIAHASGFYDQSHFIANFKRMYHRTPKQLLQELKGC